MIVSVETFSEDSFLFYKIEHLMNKILLSLPRIDSKNKQKHVPYQYLLAAARVMTNSTKLTSECLYFAINYCYFYI